MAKNMELLCRMCKFSAMEYMRFLKRYDIECFGLSITFGGNFAIYADEEKYLRLSIEDNIFNENEKQLVNLLELIEETIESYAKAQQDMLENYDEFEEKQLHDEDEFT